MTIEDTAMAKAAKINLSNRIFIHPMIRASERHPERMVRSVFFTCARAVGHSRPVVAGPTSCKAATAAPPAFKRSN